MKVPAVAFPLQDAATRVRGPNDSGVTIVISPLIALMKDQVDALVKTGIEAARLDSSLTMAEAADVKEGVRSRRIRILYVAPER